MDNILLKLLSVLTVGDVREMKRLGLGGEIESLLKHLSALVMEWLESGKVSKRALIKAKAKLNQLWAVLRG